MYIEECGYHALDNVYAVKGSTATRKTDSLLLLLPYQQSSKHTLLYRIPTLEASCIVHFPPRHTTTASSPPVVVPSLVYPGPALALVVSSLEAKVVV